jgi:hypothetical protein
MLKSPPDSLPGHAKGLVDLLSVSPSQDHTAWLTRLELYRKIP